MEILKESSGLTTRIDYVYIDIQYVNLIYMCPFLESSTRNGHI
jgi:hypothetical protein